MSTTALILDPQQEQPKNANAILAQRHAIQVCMAQAMRKDVDYGTVPGTNKPSLYKPGSEKLLSMFHLATKPEVEDLSTPDTIRYRVTLNVMESGSGRFLGAGVGEASSAETKYQWRRATCDAEWEDTPLDRRRRKWNRDGSFVPQVRAEMEDVANTVLKMAKKRAQIDAVLTVTAASDVFSQDLEDLPPEIAHAAQEEGQHVAQTQAQPLPDQLQRKSAPVSSGGPVISEAQARRAYAIRKSQSQRSDDEVKAKLLEKIGHGDDKLMPVSQYNAYVAWLQGGAW